MISKLICILFISLKKSNCMSLRTETDDAHIPVCVCLFSERQASKRLALGAYAHAGLTGLKGHVSPSARQRFLHLSPLMNWQSHPRLIFTRRYWAILKLWLLTNVAHIRAGGERPRTHLRTLTREGRAHTHTLVYNLSWSGAAPPPNRSITFSSNDNDIIRPFICGVIHVDSHPLWSFPAIAFLSDSCPAR